jgi:scyllo-inositol 2-dehydrogenase (NADP+)
MILSLIKIKGVAMKAIMVGYGLSGKVFHVPLLKAAGVEVAAVVTLDDERRAQVRSDCPQALVCDDLSAALSAAPDAALVVVASTTASHTPLAIEALQAGRHVVVDKPVALTADEFRQVIDVAHTSGRLVIPFQNRRWDADFLTLRGLLSQNALGEVVRYEARFDRYNPVVKERWREHNVAGAGMIYDLGPHLIDQVLQLFGRPDWVFCTLLQQRAGAQIDDGFELVLGKNDSSYPYVTLGASMFSSLGDAASGAPRFKVFGRQGTWLKSGFDPQEAPLRAGEIPTKIDWQTESEAARGRLLDGVSQAETRTQAGVGQWPYFYAQVARAISGNGEPPVLASEAVVTCEVIDAALASHQRGMKVHI